MNGVQLMPGSSTRVQEGSSYSSAWAQQTAISRVPRRSVDMRISAVAVRGFRSLKDVKIELGDYGVLIGANGSGKSSILYALDWFFGNRQLAPSDVHGFQEGTPLPDEAAVEVGVTFSDLSAADRARLQQYGRGERAEFRRSWHPATNQSKYVGNARQGDGFAELRSTSGVPAQRQLYLALRARYSDLPVLPGNAAKDAILGAMAAWESDPTHEAELVEVPDDDATHMFGINGGNVLRDCMRLVLVPAAVNIAGQVGETARGSALNELIGAVMSDASAKAQAAWRAENANVLEKLSTSVRTSVESSTAMQADRINDRLKTLIPNASVALTPTVPDWTPKGDPSVSTAVTIDGATNDVSRQGHGVQRAVMMSMLQALVPDEDLATRSHAVEEGEDEEASEARLREALAALPTLVVCIEEPEIYQHPIRARSFARTLTVLSGQPHVQVVVATHSPYFVRPDQFASLHRFTLNAGCTNVEHATVARIAAKTGMAEATLTKSIDQKIPTEFSEGFFADKVAVVEGPTDRVVLEAVAAKLGTDLDSYGVSVLEVGGKNSLHACYEILCGLGVPTYVLGDGDFGGAKRKYPSDARAEAQAHGSHQKQTGDLIAWLPAATAVLGSVPPTFGATTIASSYTLWCDDIEEELAAWPSFVTEATKIGLAVQTRSDKNVMLYRQAILAASDVDVPVTLRNAVAALVSF